MTDGVSISESLSTSVLLHSNLLVGGLCILIGGPSLRRRSMLLSYFLVGGLYILIGGPSLLSLSMLLCHSFGGWSLITHSRWSFFTRPVNGLSRNADMYTFLYCMSVVYKYLKFPYMHRTLC